MGEPEIRGDEVWFDGYRVGRLCEEAPASVLEQFKYVMSCQFKEAEEYQKWLWHEL